MRIIFMGSPEFAVPSLRALIRHYNVVGVFTQPDRRAGRGQQLTPPPVKTVAGAEGIPIYQPVQLRSEDSIEQVASLAPDLIVVAAYGQILPSAILELPAHGCINIHASLLPRWRGASPIQAAIRAGDKATGITIMKMDVGLDTGPIIMQAMLPIPPAITGGGLSTLLAELGAETMVSILPGYLRGDLVPQSQPAGETYAPLLRKSDGLLIFSEDSNALIRQIRAFHPWPGTYFHLGSQRIAVHRAQAAPGSYGEPGETMIIDHLPAVATADGIILLEQIQPAGKKMMEGKAFLRGSVDFSGRNVNTD
ncbi:MAG: methionyl-tRNA formyltransferase [Anaerolineales bacterium]|nr:methionyl-tRNA formyltransferase [Anaerolineales bacterium]